MKYEEKQNMESQVIHCSEEMYPQKLLKIKEYPQQLYCMGNTQLLNCNRTVAIVGSRNCTEYGRKYAHKFANELAKKGICIISGLAVGIDAAAHCGAVSEIGSTIAVLGGGLKDVFPKENLWLYNQIINEKGCVITEYAEDEETKMSNFPKRNRLISGIADAVLVIEATHRSGSRITAKYAMSQGKKVYCIPVNLDQKNSDGINELLAKGAKIVTSPSQLIHDLYSEDKAKATSYNTKNKIEKNDGKKTGTSILDNLMKNTEFSEKKKEIYIKIYNLLDEEMSVDEIARKLKIRMEEINANLTMMEIEGYIEQTTGNKFIRINE